MRFQEDIADETHADSFKVLDRVTHADIKIFRLPHFLSDLAW